MNLQNLIKYYSNCYREDNLRTRIIDIFSKSIENKYFFEQKEELITGFLPYYPLEYNYGEKTAKKIKISEKEKDLVYSSLFITGKSERKRFGNNKVRSPLFIYPAEIIKKDNDFFVKINKEQRRINFSIINELIDDDNLSEFNEKLYEIVENKNIDNFIIAEILNLFSKYTDIIDTSELVVFPELLDKKTFQNLFRRKIISEDEKFLLVPASVLAVVKKSVNTRGIINELEQMSESQKFSEPLKTIFANKEFSEKSESKTGLIPAILNYEQKNIINNSSKYPFNVIIGPPGTGKSYTISALAIEKMSKGKSVLIAASTDKAVDIIAEKIENQLNLKNVFVRAGKRGYKRDLIIYINKILRYNYLKKNNSRSVYRDLKNTERRLKKVQRLFKARIEDELKWGKYIAENINTQSFFVNLKRKYIEFRNERAENHWEVEEDMQNLYKEKNNLIQKYIALNYTQRVHNILQKDRNTVNTLLKALKTRIGTVQKQYFDKLNYKTIFKIFPIWLVKMSDIYKFLPLKTELFDYVIIDEATQSNIAQAVPIIQRAKRAIITGDPKQLRHFSFLSAAKQKIFTDKYNLNDCEPYLTNYKKNSLLDILIQSAKFNQQFTNLNEHFRSLPAIINFSNNCFYDENLRIMTNRPDLPQNTGIKVIDCNGQRQKNGYNKEEATQILDNLQKIIKKQENLTNQICSSIGILSPFRDQVEYIQRLVTKNLSYNDIKKHNISIDTAYGFQGDERDIMMISFAVDNLTNATAIRYLNKKDVFNVSVTRARKMQYIFISVDISKLKFDNILKRYIQSIRDIKVTKTSYEIHDKFLNEVEQELLNKKYRVWKKYKIAGLNIDLVIKKNNKIIGIDLIGYPGQFSEAFTTERYKMLNRAGLDTFPLPFSYWSSNKHQCLKEIDRCVQ